MKRLGNPALPMLESLPAELATAINSHNEAATKVATDLENTRTAADIDRQTGTFDAVVRSKEINWHSEALALQALAGLWTDRAVLCDKLLKHFRSELPKLEQAHGQAIVKACAQLEAAGLGLESRPGWRVNQAIAQRQLEALAAEALPVRKAAAAVATCHAQCQQMRSMKADSEAGLAATQDALRKLSAGGNRFATAS